MALACNVQLCYSKGMFKTCKELVSNGEVKIAETALLVSTGSKHHDDSADGTTRGVLGMAFTPEDLVHFVHSDHRGLLSNVPAAAYKNFVRIFKSGDASSKPNTSICDSPLRTVQMRCSVIRISISGSDSVSRLWFLKCKLHQSGAKAGGVMCQYSSLAQPK